MFFDESHKENNRGVWVYRGYEMTEEEVKSALASATSIKDAARKINVSYPTMKKYAEMFVDHHSGKTLFEMFKNQSGKGLKKSSVKFAANRNLDTLLRQGQEPKPEKMAKLKEIILEKFLLPQVCDNCGFCERRLTDMRVPLLLNFKNKNRTDWRLENLQFLCYNCFFLYVGNPLTMETIKRVEAIDINDEVYKKEVESFVELDQVYLDHLKSLGLDDEGDVVSNIEEEDLIDLEDEGNEFIDLV